MNRLWTWSISNLDQFDAVKTALTKELAIIQGPPGTGKTYIGLKVTKVLLDNKTLWTKPGESRPILVVCYTNHALDQFLEGILDFCPDGIVRVGSRSKCEALQKFNLKALRGRRRRRDEESSAVQDSTKEAHENMQELGEKVMNAFQLGSVLSRVILKEETLEGCMLPGQYDSLTDTGPTFLLNKSGSFMADWLAFGCTLLGRDDGSDAYNLLRKELTDHILHGVDTDCSPDIDLEKVSAVPYRDRACLYRSWLKKVIERAMTQSKPETQRADARRLYDFSPSEILPDDLLQPVVDPELFSAITSTVQRIDNELTRYCIRAWLGVDTSSKKVVGSIVQGMNDNLSDTEFTPRSALSAVRRDRIRLYRHWLKTLTDKTRERMEAGTKNGRMKFSPKALLEKAQQAILADETLKQYIHPELFSAIKHEMMRRLEQRKKYCIRTWLGIDDFSRDPQHLQKILDEYTGQRKQPQIATAESERAEAKDKDTDDVTRMREERQLDGADDLDLFRHNESGNLDDVIVTSETDNDGEDGGWSIPKEMRKKRLRQVQRSLQSSIPMTEDEARAVTDLWDPQLTLEHRVRLYKFWVTRYQPHLKRSLVEDAEGFLQEAKLHEELRFTGDCEILRGASVVGMTTTGAARYRKVLASVACPLVIIEEAAEVLEAHVVTTLHESCQHLILIGDHQQLRPSPTVYELCRHYHLDLSLFERLVNNNLPHSTLAVQHRMRPEVSRLVRHVYPHLEDHETTQERPNISGLQHNVFLFHHEVSEATHDETSSKSNQHEAELCVELCRYLLLQGYSCDVITILAAYTGQLLLLKAIMNRDREFFQGVLVTSVDNYQGEENDVIILSLVRSNEEGSVGFLGTDNRVCVALSRARNGLYAFGNFRILAERSDLWKNIVKTAKANGQMGDALVLQCANHPETEQRVVSARDFKNAPLGGCSLPCKARLDCGHACTLFCHPADQDHELYKCTKKCERQVCKENLHPCPKPCHEPCGRCMVMVEKTVPGCSHSDMVPCSADPSVWSCTRNCESILPCGHRCSSICGKCQQADEHDKCPILVERTWPCGHKVKAACYQTPDDVPCTWPCGAKLDCGHDCTGTCSACFAGRIHVMCNAPCGKILQGCGHKCPLTCGTKCLPCKKDCRISCRHGQCIRPCGQPCSPCSDEPCPWRCEHVTCTATCDKPCYPCPRKCGKMLKCGHSCRGQCGEKCLCLLCESSNIIPLSPDGSISAETPLSPTNEQQQGQEPKPVSSEVLSSSEKETAPSGDNGGGSESERNRGEPGSGENNSGSQSDDKASYLKLRGCGHVFRTDHLDAFVEKKLKTFCGYFLKCPACTEGTLDCWRYHRRFQTHHQAVQTIKRRLITATSVPEDRKEMILASMATLKAAEEKDCFASVEAREKLEKATLNVNSAFALTVKTKLMLATEIIIDLLQEIKKRGDPLLADSDKERLWKPVEALHRLLLKPERTMTGQQHWELTSEVRRLAYVVLLHYVKAVVMERRNSKRRSNSSIVGLASSPGSPIQELQAETRDKDEEMLQLVHEFLGMLETGNKVPGPISEIQKLLEDVKRVDSEWRVTVNDRGIFDILDSPMQ